MLGGGEKQRDRERQRDRKTERGRTEERRTFHADSLSLCTSLKARYYRIGHGSTPCHAAIRLRHRFCFCVCSVQLFAGHRGICVFFPVCCKHVFLPFSASVLCSYTLPASTCNIQQIPSLGAIPIVPGYVHAGGRAMDVC